MAYTNKILNLGMSGCIMLHNRLIFYSVKGNMALINEIRIIICILGNGLLLNTQNILHFFIHKKIFKSFSLTQAKQSLYILKSFFNFGVKEQLLDYSIQLKNQVLALVLQEIAKQIFRAINASK